MFIMHDRNDTLVYNDKKVSTYISFYLFIYIQEINNSLISLTLFTFLYKK